MTQQNDDIEKLREVLTQIKVEMPKQFVDATIKFCDEQRNFNYQIWNAVNALKEAWQNHAKEYQATLLDIEKRLRALEQANPVVNPLPHTKLN